MALQADLLESIPQTRYLSAESYISYRAIMRTFYLEYQKMHYQLDKDTIFNSIRKTHRAAVVEESNKTAGIGAELAAMFQEELYDELDGPVARIAALDVPMPYNIAMEHYSIPDVNRICASIRAMMD